MEQKITLNRIVMYAMAASFLLTVVAGMGGVSAQSGAIGISPAYPKDGNERSRGIFIHSEIDPGETIDDGVIVANNTEDDITVLVGGVDTVDSVGGSFACQQESEKQTKVGKWFKFEEKEFEVPAGKKITVDFQLQVPEKVSPGEHNGCVVVRQKPKTDNKDGASSGINLSYRSGIRMSVTIKGDIVKQLTYNDTEITRLKNGNYSVWPKAKNTGNVSLDVKVRTQLISLFGNDSQVKDSQYPIFPEATGTWKFEFDRPYWGGIYKSRTSLSYNANTSDGLGEGVAETRRLRHESGWFVMLPALPALLAELAVILALVLVPIVLLWKRRSRKVILKKSEEYVVGVGESLASIANKHNITWKKLAKINGLQAPYQIVVGDILLVPSLIGKTKKINRRLAERSAGLPSTGSTPRSAYDQSDRQERLIRAAVPKEDRPQSSLDWVSPRESLNSLALGGERGYSQVWEDEDDSRLDSLEQSELASSMKKILKKSSDRTSKKSQKAKKSLKKGK